jgi:hypothetical protein
MKKVAGVLLVMALAGAMLSGCYSKACDQQQPVPYKDR